MSDDLSRALFSIVYDQLWLYMSDIADELFARTGVRFSREHIHATLVSAKYSLKTMQRVAASRDELHRFEYWKAIKELITDPHRSSLATRPVSTGALLAGRWAVAAAASA